MDLAAIRREYSRAGLQRESLNPDPLVQLEQWLAQAVEAGLPDPTAMTVATVNSEGQPSQRIVLLKHLDERGLVFYTNLESRKATELALNPRVSLHFPWHYIDRQVKICGKAEPLSFTEVSQYFLSRPKESQMAAWASAQSRPISSRQLLMAKFNEIKQRFSAGKLEVPKFWGGYRVRPHEIEFWQGGEHRLHDRFRYQKSSDGEWRIERLMP